MSDVLPSKQMDVAFEKWWRALTRQGDPLRRPNLVSDAFRAGWDARGEGETPSPQPEFNERPAAWIKGHVSHTDCGVDYDEEVVPGSDCPRGEGWTPLYAKRHVKVLDPGSTAPKTSSPTVTDEEFWKREVGP